MKKRKDGRYQTSVYLGTDDEGRKKYRCICGKTQAEVKRKAAELNRQRHRCTKRKYAIW